MHFYDKPEDSKKLKSMVGDNPITEDFGKQGEHHEKNEMFEAIDYLTSSARKLYMDGSLTWSDMCTDLAEAISRLASKERKLKAMVPKKENTDVPTILTE